MTIKPPCESLTPKPIRFVALVDVNLEKSREASTTVTVQPARYTVDHFNTDGSQMPVPNDPAWKQLTQADYELLCKRLLLPSARRPEEYLEKVWADLTEHTSPARHVGRTYWLGSANDDEKMILPGPVIRMIDVADIIPPNPNSNPVEALLHEKSMETAAFSGFRDLNP